MEDKLFDKYKFQHGFGKALADYKRAILRLVDEMIDENMEYPRNDHNIGYKSALEELKGKIESL